MGKVYFSHDQIHRRPNPQYPTAEPAQIHFHFRPARPANLCVTRDPDTGEINVSAGTIGPLTWNPYTMCLHINIKGSPHTYRNLRVGGPCVVGLPGRDIVPQTWFTALPLPRGISEAEVAGLHLFESKQIAVPGVVECPVNFECTVEFKHDYHTHGIFFVRVLGASINEEVLKMDRQQVVHWYPTYEVDDVSNAFGGDVERLGVMGEIIACPSFPLAPKAGWYQSFDRWMRDLAEERYISEEELQIILAGVGEFDALFAATDNPRRQRLQRWITRLCQSIVQERWEDIRAIVREFDSAANP